MKFSDSSRRIKQILGYKVTFGFIVRLSGFSAIAGMIFGWLGGYFWFFDLFSHFQVQYFLALLFACAFIIIEKSYILSIAIGIFLLANFAQIMPFYLSEKASLALPGGSLRILFANVNTDNNRYDMVQKLIHDEDPDIVALEEISNEWLKNLGDVKKSYPYQLACPQDDNFGIALFSRIPLTNQQILFWGDYRLPYIEASMMFEGKKYDLIVIHTLPPVGRNGWNMRNAQIEDFVPIVRDRGAPVILLGDLNITAWSPNFKKFLKSSGMRNSMKGFGIQPTWPATVPPLLIPLDQCLVSKDIAVLNCI